MAFKHIYIFPVIAVCCLLIGIFGGYIIGVGTGHYPAVLPFISDGGAYKPEASIFGQFLNLAAFFYVITIYIRHLNIVAYYEDYLHWDRTAWWYASFLLMLEGFASSLGLSLVANFRENDVIIVHLVGALLAFFGMVIYGWGQLFLSYALVPRMVSQGVNHARLLIMTLTTASLILNMVSTFSDVFVPPNAGPRPNMTDPKDRLNKDSPYFKQLVIAASSEWAMTLIIQLFVLSFVVEMSSARASGPQLCVEEKDDCDGNIAF